MIVKQVASRWKGIITVGVSCMLLACTSQPVARTAPEVTEPTPSPQPSTQVYFYPLHDQNAEQQDRDRYECYLWAKQQTGFDPSAPQLAPHQRVKVIAQPAPGADAAVGAVTGAIIGSMVTAPHDSGQGAVVGAVAGAMIGAASDEARQQEAERIQTHYDRRAALRNAHIEEQAGNYRRAMTACLEGRGYSVR